MNMIISITEKQEVQECIDIAKKAIKDHISKKTGISVNQDIDVVPSSLSFMVTSGEDDYEEWRKIIPERIDIHIGLNLSTGN